VIKIVLASQAVVLSILALLAADLYAHTRVEMVGGVNIWGYRGPVAKQRTSGDHRLLFVGGTRAYGYGAAADGTITTTLEWDLTGDLRRPVTVINAAVMGATASDYSRIVSHRLTLDPDTVCIYDDLGRAATRPRESRLARAANGYTPALPLVLEEKGMAWRFGSVAGGYAGATPTGNFFRRAAGASLQQLGATLGAIESPVVPATAGTYASFMLDAADAALASASRVLIVVDLPHDDVTRGNRAALEEAIRARGDARVTLLPLSDVGGPDTLLDGYSHNAVGRFRVAIAMRAVLRELLRSAPS
jgi:hypothetical protein